MRRLLLDTNVIVWLLLGARDRVPANVVAVLEDTGNFVAVSAVSVWEIAIKRSLDKLTIDPRWPSALASFGFASMPVTALHAAGVETLPWHHRDPFDRLLIAQAGIEQCELVTADTRLADYEIERFWK